MAVIKSSLAYLRPFCPRFGDCSRHTRPPNVLWAACSQRDEMPFTLWFDDICEQPARVVLERVAQSEKMPLGDLRIYDFLREGERLLRWGVYFFHSQEGECLYVGKNSTQKFVEPIPIHFCLEPNTWMTHLVKRIQKFEGLACLTDAAEAARRHTLLLMPVSQNEQRKWLAALERFFRLFAMPKYNALALRLRHKGIDLGAPLSEVLQYMQPRGEVS
jgi:hypothetical protein